MKSKADFVTNSSSTSFIIASKDSEEKLKMNYVLKVNLIEALTPTIVRTFHDLNEHIDKSEDSYDRVKKIIEEGGIVYLFEVENYGNPVGSHIYYEGIDMDNFEDKSLIHIRRWDG